MQFDRYKSYMVENYFHIQYNESYEYFAKEINYVTSKNH